MAIRSCAVLASDPPVLWDTARAWWPACALAPGPLAESVCGLFPHAPSSLVPMPFSVFQHVLSSPATGQALGEVGAKRDLRPAEAGTQQTPG